MTYASVDNMTRALMAHNRRVRRARGADSGSALAAEPLLTLSGTTVMRLVEERR
ncbi:hypothetical protein [Streptomyces niveus]|uniref:hypothetical protein n=1 Tax=Streptomyces niveus TaxID=193462 RepID=UPI00386339A4